MVGRNDHETAHPFLYVGLLFIAVAVVISLLADNPYASATVVFSLEVFADVFIVCGLTALFIAPFYPVKRKRF